MVSNEVFVGAGVSVTLIPESRINLGKQCYKSYGLSTDNKNTLVRYSVGELFRNNYKLIPDLYTGCQVALFDGTSTTYQTITSNDIDSIYLSGKLSDFPDLSGATAYMEIQPLGAPLPAPILKGANAVKTYENASLSAGQTSITVADGTIYNIGDKLYSDVDLTTLLGEVIATTASTCVFNSSITETASVTNGSANVTMSSSVDGIIKAGSKISIVDDADSSVDVHTVKSVNGVDVVLTAVYAGTTDASEAVTLGQINTNTLSSAALYVDEGRTLLSDNWLGLVNTVSPPSVEVEMKQLNLTLSGSRNFAYQYKGAETVSGGSMDLSLNNGSWLYYALGKMSALSATHTLLHSDGAIQGLTIANAGANLTDGDYTNKAISNGDGSSAKANFTVSNSVVSAVSVHTAGSGYLSTNSGLTVPSITINPDRPFATGADIVAVMTTNTSDGVNGAPHTGLATTSNGAGTGATVNLTVANNVVTGALINAVGDNYSVGDTLTIATSTALGGSTAVVFTLSDAADLALATQPTFAVTSTSNPVDSHNAADVALTTDRLYMVNDANTDDQSGPYFHRGIKGSNALVPPLAAGQLITTTDLVTTPTLSGTTISNPFEYVFGEADNERLPSFALEVNYEKGSLTTPQIDNLNPNENVKSDIIVGNQLNTLTLNFEEGQELKTSLDFSALRKFGSPNKYVLKNYRGTDLDTTINTNLQNFSSVDSFNKPFFYFDGTIKMFGQPFARVKTGSLTITNNLTQHRFIGNYNRQRMSTQIPGQRTYELSFTSLVTDSTIADALRTDLEYGGVAEGQEIELTFTKDNNEQISIVLKDYLISASSWSIPDDKGPIECEMTVMARNLETCTYTGAWMLQG